MSFRVQNTKRRSFFNIISCILQVSLAARQLIHGLLNRDPANRLGSKTGANEIKQHPFFREINWPLIRCMVIFHEE